MSYHYDFYFWVSVAGAIVVKLLLGEHHSFRRSIATGLAGIWFAWTFTIPAVAFAGVSNDEYLIGVAGLLALTGEGIARQVINLTEDSAFIKALVHKVLGLGKPSKQPSETEKSDK